MPKFQLTYLTFTDKEKFLGHACVGITETKEDGSRELLFRVGLFPTNQVEIEDFIKSRPGRNFEERSFDISEEQLVKVLQQINQDRRLETPESSRPRQPETKAKLHAGQQSAPMGPGYSKRNYNCKDYALSLVRAAGIDDAPLTRKLFGKMLPGISIPLFSGKLNKVILVPKENGVIKLQKPEESRNFVQKIIDSIKQIINYKKYKSELQTIKSGDEASSEEDSSLSRKK